jgi:benzoate membrane transport protein
MNAIMKDLSPSSVTSGFLVVLISYFGPLVIFFQVGAVGNISAEMMSSWIWAISIGAGVSGIYLSWKYKSPIITAWSAPGSALLITLVTNTSMSLIVGAYLTAALIIFLVGVTGSFDWLIKHIPKGLAAGMMAGILFQFVLGSFKALQTMPTLAFSMIFSYLVCKKLFPRLSIVLTLFAGLLSIWLLDQYHVEHISFEISRPIFIAPAWDLQSTLSLALPLVLVSLSGQYLPGMALLKVSGYHTPAKPLIMATSFSSFLMAFFGGITIVTASITAAICTTKDAHPDPDKRYIAGLSSGVFFLIAGFFATAIVAMFSGFPREFVAILAGLALLGAFLSNISIMVEDVEHREAAFITFLATASGVSLAGVGPTFWGVVMGGCAYFILRPKAKHD